MGLFKLIGGIVIFMVVTATIGIAAMQTKADFLGSKVGSCPEAAFGLMSMVSNPGAAGSLIQNVWDCGIGVMLYLALPGLGLSWFITKHIMN